MNGIELTLALARAELKYKEKATNAQLNDPFANAGSGNFTKYGKHLWEAGFFGGMSKNGYDWCAQFVVDRVFHACQDKALTERVLCFDGPYGAGCVAASNYYRNHGRFFTEDPQPGDQIFFRGFSHTGLVEAVQDGWIITLEGNTGNQMVERLQYRMDDPQIDGFGRPLYDLIPEREITFVDVAPNDYYAEAVAWADENGIVSGTSDFVFSPHYPCTRAQAMTMIWAMMGKPEPEGRYHPFADVQPADWYAKAVQWAVQHGLTSGVSGSRFGPDLDCTRGQIVTYLWRLAGSPEQGSNQFADIGPGDYFYQACSWAAAAGITAGTGNDRFSPEDPCTRAQIVTMLHAYSKL